MNILIDVNINDIWNEVFDKLDIDDILRLRELNHYFNDLICNKLQNEQIIDVKYENIIHLNNINGYKGIKNLYYDLELIDENLIMDKDLPSNIISLSLQHNETITNIQKLTVLMTLNSHCAEIVDIQTLTKITTLCLGRNINITDIKTLTNITRLALYPDCKIRDISGLKKIHTLNLCGDFLSIDEISNNIDIYSSLFKLLNLKTLIISNHVNIKNIDIKDLTNLTDLQLYHKNNITEDGIKDLINLKTLYICSISDNKNINGLMKLTNLISLSFFNPSLTDKNLSPLHKLKYLSLTNTNLITDNSLSRLTNLIELNLNCNKSKITDDCLLRLTNLKSLSLRDNNKITNKGICNHTNLTKLDIGTNDSITEISHLHNLKTLYADHNDKIGYSQIENLSKLKKLYCCNNYLLLSELHNISRNLKDLNVYTKEEFRKS